MLFFENRKCNAFHIKWANKIFHETSLYYKGISLWMFLVRQVLTSEMWVKNLKWNIGILLLQDGSKGIQMRPKFRPQVWSQSTMYVGIILVVSSWLMERRSETTQFHGREVGESKSSPEDNPRKTYQGDHREWFVDCNPSH